MNYMKSIGFSDNKISELTKKKIEYVKNTREKLGVFSIYKKTDVAIISIRSFDLNRVLFLLSFRTTALEFFFRYFEFYIGFPLKILYKIQNI